MILQKKTKILAIFMTGYIGLSLPIVTVFYSNDYFRFVYFEILSGWRAKFTQPRYIFCGDSITAGGRNWGFRLEGNLFNSRNLAGNGYTVSQISNQVSMALKDKPNYVFIMAGTNDILTDKFSLENTLMEYENMIDKFIGTKTIPVFTIIPLTSRNTKANEKIKVLNAQLLSLLKSKEVASIDLTPYLSPAGYLSRQYTTDGVHFSDLAYQLWAREIKKTILNPKD